MKLIAFIPGQTRTSSRLRQAAEEALPGLRFEVFTNRQALLGKLNEPLQERHCILLYTEKKADLSFFIAHAGRLLDFKLVLILPQQGSEILSRGLKLCPRYIGYADSDFAEVTVVLRKILLYGTDGRVR